jgi:hypothetical protein
MFSPWSAAVMSTLGMRCVAVWRVKVGGHPLEGKRIFLHWCRFTLIWKRICSKSECGVRFLIASAVWYYCNGVSVPPFVLCSETAF